MGGEPSWACCACWCPPPASSRPAVPAVHAAQAKRAKTGPGGGYSIEKMGEQELWNHLLNVLAECANKQGGSGRAAQEKSRVGQRGLGTGVEWAGCG